MVKYRFLRHTIFFRPKSVLSAVSSQLFNLASQKKLVHSISSSLLSKWVIVVKAKKHLIWNVS